MTIDQIIIAAALWCSPDAFKLEIGLVNVCRKDIITCVQSIKKDRNFNDKALDCFLNKKI